MGLEDQAEALMIQIKTGQPNAVRVLQNSYPYKRDPSEIQIMQFQGLIEKELRVKKDDALFLAMMYECR